MCARAQALLKTMSRETWKSDPGIRIQVEAILAMPPAQRLNMLMAELSVFARARLVAE
ncbi:hypothetical protein [Frankia nepalensis]|uniref:hypothetical protein n=1 Tax=Frankia nepalensis TaxID=1836974 RepID=UPI001EE4B69F|nr:hypothetical protein [Frankia nepalensis]